MHENIKWVYDELKKIDKDYDLGDYEEFDSIMNADGESRKWVYEQLQNNGYDIGDTYEEFESYIVPKSLSSLWEGDAPGAINDKVANISPNVIAPQKKGVESSTQVVEQVKATNQEQASGKVTDTPIAPSAPKVEATAPTATTSVEVPKVESTARPVSAVQKADGTPYNAEELQDIASQQQAESTAQVAEQPKSVATETPTQETEQSTTPLSVQRDVAEQKGEEGVTGVQEETELPADEYWATHAKELGQLVPQAPQGYVVDNMPQFVTVGMLNNFYTNQYDAKVSGVIYNTIKRNMTKDGVEPTEEDVKAKIATMSEDAIANALNDEDKNAIYALKDEFKRADSNKSNASAMISKVIDATPEEDRKQEGVFLEIPDNMLAEALSNVVNGTDKDLEEYIASEDYNKVYRKAIADWANVKELFGEEAYNNTINGTGLDQYVHLGSLWRKMFGVADGANYPKQYENLVTSKMRDVYSAEDKKGALDNLYNAIGTIDSYIDVKNKLSQEELDAVLAQVNATIPWGSKLASWDDVFFYNHSKDAEVPYAMTAQARALMALNDYTDNVTMARANDGAIKTLEEQIQKKAEENRAKAKEQVNANPLKYSNEILLTPNSLASNFGMDTEYDYLNSALEIRKEAKEYRDNASVDEGFVANLWRGLTDKALDLGTWDFGLGEFKEAGMLMAITNKSDRGEALTAGEEAFLDAIATRLATFATTKATKGYSTGASTAESLAFMLEFAITPIKGGGALANKFARMMIAKYGKTMARKQAIKYSIGKGLAYVGGDLVKAGGMTATTGLPSVVADAMKRNIGDVSYTQMNDGSIVALHNNDGSIKTTTTKKIDGVETTTEGGESWGTAIKNAFLSRTATNMSEAIGAYLPGKAFAKTVGNKLGLSKLVKAYDKMSATDWAKAADRFFKKTQWNGLGQEYVEELVDGTLQALITQDTSVSDVFETENLIDTALAVGVMSVLMSGAKTMGYRTASHQLKQDINNTTITGQDLFGKSEWSQIQSAIDGSTADNMSANVQSLINNNELSAPQKKTILRYAMQVAERDALLTNEDKQALAYEGEANIDNTARLQASAYQGYHTTDAKEQFITNQQYIEKGKAVANMLGGEDADKSLQQRYKTNGSYELADKVSHDTSLDVKQKQAILDYLGAKEKVASMGVRAQNDINNATIDVGREVERKSNIQTGGILTVTHKYDGKQYYVIDGNVVTNQDGSINLDETTDDIIVEDAESGERMMMSSKMFAEAQLKPSGIKDAMREELNRRAEAYNNTIKYGHTLAVGSNITLRNAEGVDENKTIASVDNNVGVVTFADGTTTTLDAIAEDARLRYSNQYPPSAVKPVVATKEEAQAENVGEPVVAEVATTESVEEEPTAELEDVATPSPTPTEYNQEEQVVFIDDNGTRIEGEIVSEVDADGKVLIEGADGGIHQVATSQIVERIGTTPVAEAQGDNIAEPTTDAISEPSSQEILDNSNEVETTTPTAETPTQSTPLTEIPTDENGKKQYEQASVEDTINDIYNDPELDEEDADAYVQARIDGASKRIAQLEKKKPKMGEDIPGFKAERAKWREQLEVQQVSLAYWQGVQEAVPEVRRRERARQQMETDLAEQERARQARAEQALRAEERGRNRGDYRKAMAQWNDTPGSFYEYVAQELLAGDYKMRWDDNGSTRGLGSHTTGRRNRNRKGEVKISRGAEYSALRWLIDNNGISPEALADRLWNNYTDSYGEDMSGANPLDVLLDVITSMPTPQMMWDYVKGEHDARMEAEQGIEEQFTEAEIEAMERDAMYREKYGVSEEEYWSQEAQWDEFIEGRYMSAEELGNYDNFVAEQRIKEEYERRNQENAEDEQRSNNSESERGTDVLSGTQSDNTRGNGDVAGESEGIDGSSVEQDDVAQEEARLSEEDRQAIENMPIPMLKRQIKETTTTLINISQLSSEWQEKNRDKIERAKLILAYAKEELARKERLKKSNKWGIKVGNTATPFSVVRKMFGEFNSNEDIAQLFDKVAKVFESLPIKIVFSDTIGSKGTQGWFSPTTATLKLPGHFVYGGRSLEQSKAETILHEMIHAVTTYALYINEKPHLQTDLGFRLPDDMHAAIRQLKRIYTWIASDKDFKGEYGATSVHEMVAELSNVQFRDKLKKKKLWETIVDAIKQLFGIKPSNALEGAEAALEYMLNNFDRRQWDKMANMRGKRNKQLMIGNTTGLVDTPASRSLEVEERTMLNRLAKALGVEIEVVPTMAEANAKIVGNKITLALDAEQGAKKALGHELLHRIKALSPEAYEEFAQVIEAINPRAFEQAMIDVRLMYSRAGRTKSRESLREEVVADMAGELMYNADLMERFVDALETKSFKEQILNAIKSVFDAIKSVFKGADARAIAKAERVLYNAMKRANMVVNQGNTTEADSANEKLSIIGERGASALDKAEEATHRMENLDMARKMERYGYPTKSIRMATGWERGADGKWRYEIEDDFVFDIDGNVDYGKRKPEQLRDYKRYKELLHKMNALAFEGKQLDAEEQVEFDDLAVIWKGTKLHNSTRLKDYIDHPELFEAYPELRDVSISFDNINARGEYDSSANEITLSNTLSPNEAKSTLIHEIQHAIQKIEGFARGGNVEASKNLIRERNNKALIWSFQKNISHMAKDNPGLSPLELIDKVLARRVELTGDNIATLEEQGAIPNEDGRIKAYNLWARGYDNEGYENAYNMVLGDDAFEVYRRHAGEVEARNVQSRIGMTPEQRRATLLAETEDVARKDQIFLMENSGVSAMGSTVVKRKADIAVKLQGKDISPTQLKVVDAFTTDVNNIAIDVVDANGKQRNITLKQGQDNRAGVKHSVLKHYETASNSYSAEDILLIPQIIEQGERKQDGKKVSYKLGINGVTYSVTTEIKGNHEEFTNFFTNKKPTIEEQGSLNTAYQHEQPQQSVSTDKGSDNIGDVQEDTKYSLRGNSQEVADIVAKAKADGTYMKAPNGEPTNLTEEQWANVRTKAFKDWFGDWENDPENASKIVDENGEPMVVYHGTESDFNVFDRTKGRASMDIQGMFFSPWELDAQGYGRNVRAFYLNIRKPSSGGQSYKALNRYQGQMYAGVKARDYLIDLGYDGVDNYGEEFIAFEPNQIKSATDNVGTYSSEDNDIRYSLRSDVDARKVATDAVITSLEGSGIEVMRVSDAEVEQVMRMAKPGVELSAKQKRALETVSVQEDEHQQTVISSADGTKVLNNLDNLQKEYEENPKTKEKTFIGEVAKAIGAERNGSGSQYVTFETKNGRIITIRLSNHNAKVSNFDNNGELEGISIVVSAKGNNGIINDGNAHIVEYYYDAIKLRRAEGKPLADIVRSIKQSLYSGEFTDTTGLAERQEVNLNEVETLRTPQGEVYGWTDGKKVYLTEKGMNPETPIHEYTHIWARAMAQKNAKGWQSVKDLLRDTPMWNEVMNDANYADIRENEDAVASEALSRLSGKENAKRMESEAQRMIDEAKGVFAKAEAITLIEHMRKALNEFWSWVGKNLFDIKEFGSIEEITDRVLYDLVENAELGASEGMVERMVSTDIDKLYPNWLEGTTTDSGKHSTQIAGTRKTYNKVGDWIEENLGKDVAILDASSGMGLGTADLRERGFNIEDVEPYQSEERKQNNPATYSSYDDIDKEYDFIISNAVLNVIPDDWRSNVLHDMAKRLKEGGRLFINTRKAGEEKSIKDKIELDSPQEVLVKRNGKIASYQRFFTPQELKSWVESELGNGYKVEVANMKNSGTSGLPAVVVMKVTPTDGDDTKYSLRSKGVLHPDKSDADGTRAKYNERVGSSGFKWREGYQDSMLSLKVLQEIIAEKHGLKEIPSWQNAYVEENEMSSRNKAMSDIYQRDFFKPLMAEVKRLIDKEGLKYEDIVTYLMAKHGLERNAVKAIEAAELLADESMPKSADGKIDRDSNAWKNAFNEAYREISKRDFSGLRGLFKTADVTIATGNAQMVVERMEQAVDTNALWKAIRSATNETLDIQRKGGLISKATYETLRDKYQFYIPLRGFNEKTAKDEYEYLTSSTPLLPPTIKRAKGRASMADDPLAHIGMLADSAIIQANRNKMKQAFYHFVVNNPSSVASVSEQWYVRNETTGRWESRNPIIPNGASADEMAEILTQFEAEMKELASNKKARRKRGDIKTDFITLPYQASEHEVRVKINGRDYTIYINGNPRAAQALNGLTNPEQFNDIITKGGRVINNFMAQMFTSKNPAFIVTNMARDLQWATNAVMVKEGFAYQKEYFKSLAEATKVFTMIAKHNKGILDMDDKTQRYFEEFLRYGGETGYTAINQIEEYKKNVERLVKDAKGMTTLPAKSWHALVDGIEYLNRSAEDFTRFAVYMASREMGRTPERSAHDAKEITVNFNKKGSGVMGARYFSAAIIFFNASLQSLNNMARMFKHHPIKMSGAMSLPALVGFALPTILKAWMGDDDDEMYNNLPDWVRRNNIVLPIFGNTFLTIPLPHEMRPFYTMGTVAYDVIFNGYDAIEGLRDVALGFADMLPIDFAGNGGNIFVNMTPTFFQPVAQIMANVDYFGKPIYKKSEFYENDPEHSIAFKGTSPILIEASRLINAIGGGNDYRLGVVEKELGSMKMLNNPDVWEHLIDSYFGGVGKTAMRTIKTAQIIYGEALELFGKENKFAGLNEVRNYPVLSSFVAGGEERTGAQYKITEQYYELLDKAKDYKEDLGDYKRAAIHDMKYAEELVEFMNTPEAKEARIVLGYDTYRDILKKHLDLVDERRLDEINRAMVDAMQEMQEAVKNAQSMTNEEILKKNSELVGKAKDLIYQEGDSVLDKNKGRLALLDAAVKYNNVDILEELLNNEQ